MADSSEKMRGQYISRDTFEKNYKPIDGTKEAHLLCEIKWGKYGKPWLHWCQNQRMNIHAEDYFMNNIFKAKKHPVHCYVTWYLSWSPCADCASKIVKFLEERPYLKLTIYVAQLYYHTEEENRKGLRLLRSKKVIIRVMDISDYNYCWKVFVSNQNGNEDYWPLQFDPWVKENYSRLLDIFWESKCRSPNPW
ncbi:C-_U-editing enzyme APOBEC-1 [Alligator mississippiensis]|uniref:C->U-editing enzyme APOBEC-1-like n=1 Tax=Alligator mississippiensis TaxID=8496 RepID=A0A151P7C9_ALLMI|nr:C->U-editing enzyme APOBEC-1 [Alligator mississippiensis]KYO44655.1 C->U-editing enzyme APOBEC-1-like [Alligator mississippiensis]